MRQIFWDNLVRIIKLAGTKVNSFKCYSYKYVFCKAELILYFSSLSFSFLDYIEFIQVNNPSEN